MKKEINPQSSARSSAFNLWMKSPMPMVTLTKTFNISRLCKFSKRKSLKLNMLICWCVSKAASKIQEFYTLPEQGKLFHYDQLAVNVIVCNKDGGISSCDIPFSNSSQQFSEDYLRLTNEAAKTSTSTFLDGYMVIGTSAMTETELDSIVNQYTDQFCNPMVMWGKYRKRWFKTVLPISFQFHHVQMDGGQAAHFLNQLQKEINAL